MRHSDDANDPVTTLAELIHGIKFAMLTTTARDGTLHSRPMATQDQRFAGELWFFTGRASHKVEDIRERPEVNVAYADPDRQRYVSVVGHADLVDDPARVRELWSPALTAWFPGGVDDPDLGLLRVRPTQADLWTSPSSAVVRIVGFLHSVATGERADIGRHEHLELADVRTPR